MALEVTKKPPDACSLHAIACIIHWMHMLYMHKLFVWRVVPCELYLITMLRHSSLYAAMPISITSSRDLMSATQALVDEYYAVLKLLNPSVRT